MFKDGKQFWDSPRLVPEAHLKSIYNYSVGESYVELDNGMVYNTRDFEYFYRNRIRRFKLPERFEES